MSASTSNLPLLPPPPAPPGWKDEVAARVRAHRTSRGRIPEDQPVLPGMEASAPSVVAARVAERYARIPSWREAMAAEAAAQAAQIVAAAAPAAKVPARPAAPRRPRQRPTAAPALDLDFPIAAAPQPPQPYQPDLIRYSVSSDSLPAPRSTPAQARVHPARPQPSPSQILDPLEEAIVEPTRLLPARVIEFPRELIAPRKARPRIAEGPLSAEPRRATTAPPASALFPDADDLRILEAEPDSQTLLSTPSSKRNQSGAVSGTRPFPAQGRESVPEWHSIRLDPEEPVREANLPARASHFDDSTLHVAPMEDRFMAGVVDVALTLAAFLVFVLVFVACTTHPPSGKPALVGAGIIVLVMWVLYQFIFFSLSAATPGMRYAKIALCTFSDDNPTRRAMRIRIAALLLSALPLGLGFLWAVFDEDALGWHDRITQTYQRSYREP
ncbi:MAG TPA: RDD family protein [Acidobacteriaceae bacterium]|nr:RDD family protein [Acidobacteriaceae bacterium]